MKIRFACAAALIGLSATMGSSGFARDRLWNAFAVGCSDATRGCNILGLGVNKSTKEEALSEATRVCREDGGDEACSDAYIYDKCFYLVRLNNKDGRHSQLMALVDRNAANAALTEHVCTNGGHCSVKLTCNH
jgi:hypothetical protein